MRIYTNIIEHADIATTYISIRGFPFGEIKMMKMKYKCLKCENEFEVTYDATCPKCGASGKDLEPFRKWKMAQAVAADES